jgi:hypothetical protein
MIIYYKLSLLHFCKFTGMSGSKEKRSKTTYEGICSVKVESWHIDFTANETLYGDQVNQFTNYLCMITRDRVSCNLRDWRDIPKIDKNLKDKMWAEI